MAAHHTSAGSWGNPAMHVFLQHIWNAGPAHTHVESSTVIWDLHGAFWRKCSRNLIFHDPFKLWHGTIRNETESQSVSRPIWTQCEIRELEVQLTIETPKQKKVKQMCRSNNNFHLWGEVWSTSFWLTKGEINDRGCLPQTLSHLPRVVVSLSALHFALLFASAGSWHSFLLFSAFP